MIPESLAIADRPFIPFGILHASNNGDTASISSDQPAIHSDDTSSGGTVDGFDKLIDDMVFQFWECSRCLSMGHKVAVCTNEIRCKKCFRYGHIKRNCLSGLANKEKRWVPKQQVSGVNDRDSLGPVTTLAVPAPDPPDNHFSLPRPSPVTSLPPYHPECNASNPKPMANFELDPTPWLPWGHHIIDGGPTRLPRTFYFPSQDPPEQHQ
jgi:hypothetical protein